MKILEKIHQAVIYALRRFKQREWPELLVVVRDTTMSTSRAGGPVQTQRVTRKDSYFGDSSAPSRENAMNQMDQWASRPRKGTVAEGYDTSIQSTGPAASGASVG